MKLKQAVEKLKEGQWASTGEWSEYSIQWYLIDGQIHWTAGMTVGGLANETSHNYKDETSWIQSMDWKIYDDWRGTTIDIKENEE